MEKTIKLTLKKAKELYGKNKEMDQLLEANFSIKDLKPFNFTDITTIRQAIEHLGYNIDVQTRRPYEEEDEWAYRMMKIVVKAINPEGWKAKFDKKQQNWYCFWSVLPSGSGFSGSVTNAGYVGTYVGSRLYFADRDRARHFAKYFEDLAKLFYLPSQK